MKSRVVVSLYVIVLLQCFLAAPAFPESPAEVLIAANSGVLEEAPENTMYAFELAVEQKASILKVDVRGTKDGGLVIMRDATIDRTTNGKGLVGDMLLEEIKVYDAGSWRGKQFKGEPVPLLREVLRFAKINGLKVILDVKDQGLENNILALVESLGMMKKVYFWGVLSHLRESEPSLVGQDLVFLTPEELTPSNIKQAHTRHKDVMTSLLNCDDMEKMRKVMLKGPDIILVDFPAVASEALTFRERRRAIRRIQKRDALTTVPFDGRLYGVGSDDAFMFEEREGGIGGIDLLDPVGVLQGLLFGKEEVEYVDGLEKGTPKAELRKEVRSLALDLYEPGLSEKGFFGKATSKFMKGMSDEEADDSRMAALEMTSLPPFAVIPQLVHALGSKRPAVRDNAVWALGLIGDYNVIPEVVVLLEDVNQEVDIRRSAALALGRLRQTYAVEPLRDVLVESNIPPVRYDAARSLGDIGDASAVGDLIRTTEGSADWRVKAACVGALGKIGDPGAVTRLGELLRQNTGAPYSIWARHRAAWALSSIGEDSLRVLLAGLRDDEEFIRRKSAWAMVRIGKPAIPALIRGLRDPDARVRLRGALALGWIGDTKAVPSLARSMYDEDFEVRQAVVWAIGHIGGVRADKVLEKLVNSDDDERIKELAGEAIARGSRKNKGYRR